MADESILTYKKPGFPRFTNNESAFQTVIEYVGPFATLDAARPSQNASWGNYTGRVVGTSLTYAENSTYGELTVTLEYNYDSTSSGTTGTAQEISFEVEWVMFQRDLLEHPSFRLDGGGQYGLESQDITDIEAWKNESNTDYKKSYQYDEEPLTGTAGTKTLTANAQKYCQLFQMGIESYEDYAPVVRRSTTYVNGLPPNSEAGKRDTPPTFSGIPQGYQWRKTADRSVRSGGQTKWERVEEWTGAITVLIDKDRIWI